MEYAKRNFRFSLLEYWATEVSDELILVREGHWKDVLQSRQHGYNENSMWNSQSRTATVFNTFGRSILADEIVLPVR